MKSSTHVSPHGRTSRTRPSPENVLPDEKLRGRYFDLLGREDTTQDEWDTFNDAVHDHVEAMDYEQLADWYVQMHDPNTIVIVLYLHDGIEYLEEECAMPWKRDR